MMVVSRHKPAGQADLFGVGKSHKSTLFYFLSPTYNCVLSVTYLHHLEDLLQTKIGLLNKRFEVQFLSVPKID